MQIGRGMEMRSITVFGLLITGILISLTDIAFAENSAIGAREFQKNCAVCHGMDGTGKGLLLDILKQTPPDLTLIAKRNGGCFPNDKIYKWIEDPSGIRAHGSQDMPVWGERYSMEQVRKWGEFDSDHPEAVQARILKLVFYLSAIQK